MIHNALATATTNEPPLTGRVEALVELCREDVLETPHDFMPGREAAPAQDDVGVTFLVADSVEMHLAAVAEVVGNADDEDLHLFDELRGVLCGALVVALGLFRI